MKPLFISQHPSSLFNIQDQLSPLQRTIFHRTKFGFYPKTLFATRLFHYFETWRLNCQFITDIDHSHQFDIMFIDNDLGFLFEYLKIIQRNSFGSKFGPTIQVIFFCPISKLSEATKKVHENYSQDRVAIVAKPIGPLKLSSHILSIFQETYPPDNLNSQKELNYETSTYFYQQQFQTQSSRILTQTISQNITNSSSSNPYQYQIQNENKVVLVVEDNLINQMVMKKQLEKLNVGFFLTSSGQEAIDYFQNTSKMIPLVFMDLNLFGAIDGLEATSKIREIERIKIQKNPFTTKTYIVYMTGRTFANQEEIMRHGGDEYLTKPMSLDIICNLVQTHVLNQ